ncbi:MAG: FAD-binding oxidoreductase [Pseudomonadota bacterium]
MLNDADEALAKRLRTHLPDIAFRQPREADHEEPRGRWRGQVGLLVRPETPGEVGTVLRLANEARVPVVARGGGTGLVGGQTMPEGARPILLSFERMTRIRAAEPENMAIIAEAGATLADLHSAAEYVGALFPLSYASEATATIGGALAVNSGGLNVLRYGTARDLCLGLEAVMADGRIYEGLSSLRKDNTGYDLRHLLIGSEGTLGVITAATVRLYPKPDHIATALVVVPDSAAALDLLAQARERFGSMISAFELISGMGLCFLDETGFDYPRPFSGIPDWLVLIEIGAFAGVDPVEGLGNLFEGALANHLVTDGVIAQSEAQRAAFWSIRENIPAANRRIGAVASHDISLPIGTIPDFLREAGDALSRIKPLRINAFGHLGDGNLHYNAFPLPGDSGASSSELRTRVTETVHDLVHKLGGSFSAEHGVGRAKTGDVEKYGDPTRLAAMQAIKKALDPNGILNPGAVLRAGV